jgi:hypothetical protein
MSIQQIGFDQSPQGLERSRDRLDKLTSHAISGHQSDDSNDDSVGRARIAKSTLELDRLTVRDDHARAVAAHIRTMDQTMDTVAATVDAMKKELEGIAQSSPPYPPESEERVKRLNSYAGLRAVIDRLTNPPDDSAQKLAQRKELEAILSNDYTFIVGQNGMTKTVLKEDVHYGPAGVYIPELAPPEAVDERAIGQALQQLDAAGELIHARREALQADAMTIGKSLYDQLMTERSAEATSVQIRQDLATQPVGIARESTTQLDQLLGYTWP